jgi:hypothetical protein
LYQLTRYIEPRTVEVPRLEDGSNHAAAPRLLLGVVGLARCSGAPHVRLRASAHTLIPNPEAIEGRRRACGSQPRVRRRVSRAVRHCSSRPTVPDPAPHYQASLRETHALFRVTPRGS